MQTEQKKIEKAIENKNPIDFKYKKKDGSISNRK
jgi:predicted DNA-binding transcriptional regulator YafY